MKNVALAVLFKTAHMRGLQCEDSSMQYIAAVVVHT